MINEEDIEEIQIDHARLLKLEKLYKKAIDNVEKFKIENADTIINRSVPSEYYWLPRAERVILDEYYKKLQTDHGQVIFARTSSKFEIDIFKERLEGKYNIKFHPDISNVSEYFSHLLNKKK